MLAWAKMIPCNGISSGVSICTNGTDVLVNGNFNHTADLDPGTGTTNVSATNQFDTYSTVLSTDGNFVWGNSIYDDGGFEYSSANDYSTVDGSYVQTLGLSGTNIDFNPGAGSYSLSAIGSRDLILRKVAEDGTFLWARRWGSSGKNTGANDLKVDAAGNIYLAGVINGPTDLDPTAGTDIHTPTIWAGFIVKLDVNGNYIWGKSFQTCRFEGIDFNSSGELIAVGSITATTDFDPGAGTVSYTPTSGAAYILKLDAGGNYNSVQIIDSPTSEYFFNVDVDVNDNINVVGSFYSTVDFDPGAGITNLTSNDDRDVVVAQYNSSGALNWAKSFGGVGYDRATAVTSDPNGQVYIAGTLNNSADINFDAGVQMHAGQGSYDAFAIFISANGDFLWGESFGSTGYDSATDLLVDDALNIYVLGDISGVTDMDPDVSVFNLTPNGSRNTFIQKLSIPAVLSSDELTLSVSQQNNDVLLQWESAIEEEGTYTLERSVDGIYWNEILQREVNSEQRHLDQHLPEGMYYYRLTQFNTNHQKIATALAQIDLYSNATAAYPNPCQNYLVLNQDGFKNATIKVSRIDGKVVFEEDVLFSSSKYILNTEDYPAGAYMLELYNGVETELIRFLKM